MKAFADLLIEFGAQEQEAPQRSANFQRDICQGDGWRLRADYPAASDLYLLTRTSTGEWTAWTVGEIHRYNGQCGATGVCTARFLADASPRPEELAGNFAIVAWSRGRRQWSVWTNRAGSVHLYYCSGARPAIGTYSPAVYAHSARRLDWTGITGFCGLGFFPRDLTYYEDVRVLGPASRHDFNAAGELTRREEYWRWRHRPDSSRSEADTIAQFGEVLGTVVGEHTGSGRVALPLSGGLDSRTLAACLPEDRRVTAYSYGYSAASVETSISREIARVCGLDFEGHTVSPYLFDRMDLVLNAVEGFQDVTQARQALVAEWLGREADFVLAGHWGDVLCDDMGVTSPVTAFDTAIKKMRKRGGEWLLENLCRPRLNGEPVEEVLRTPLGEEYAMLDGIADADFRVKALKTTQWAFRWTLASLRMYQAGAYPRIPFLDPRVIDFFCTVPTEMVRGRRLQIEYLKRFAPDLARIRWQAWDADLFHYQQFGTWQLPRRAWKKVERMLRPELRLQRNWEVQFCGPDQWTRWEEWLLRRGAAIHEFVPPEKVRELAQVFRARPDGANGYTVSILVTVAAWLEKFHTGAGAIESGRACRLD